MSDMPLVRVLDFEATDFPENGGRICSYAFVDLSVGQPLDFDWGETVGVEGELCNPGIHIPSTASAIHHITDEDVQECAPFNVQEIMWKASCNPLIPDCDDPEAPVIVVPPPELVTIFAAHNAKAERSYLANHLVLDVLPEARWICTYKCAMRQWPDAPGHSNQALRYELGLDVPRSFRGHEAGMDVVVTALLLERLLDQVPLETLIEWSENPVLQKVCRIGDWRGRQWAEVDSGFMRWILGKDFDEDVLFTCRHWLAVREEEERERYREVHDGTQEDVAGQVLEQRGQQRLL